MNPLPVDMRPRVLSTSIDPDDPSASIDLAFAAADYFWGENKKVRAIAAEIGKVVSTWRSMAEKAG